VLLYWEPISGQAMYCFFMPLHLVRKGGVFPKLVWVFCLVPVAGQMAIDFFAVGFGLWLQQLQRGGPLNISMDASLGENHYESRNTPEQDAVIQLAKEAKTKVD